MPERHMELFGPDLGRGPFAVNSIETAAIQIATAIAQLRTPITRADADIQAHADFIRGIADRLAPDYAAAVAFTVGAEVSDFVQTSVRLSLPAFSLLECWLADSNGGGETATAPDDVTWNTGVVLETITANKRYRIITPSTGVANVTVGYTGAKTWRWAVSRLGRVFYSTTLFFT